MLGHSHRRTSRPCEESLNCTIPSRNPCEAGRNRGPLTGLTAPPGVWTATDEVVPSSQVSRLAGQLELERQGLRPARIDAFLMERHLVLEGPLPDPRGQPRGRGHGRLDLVRLDRGDDRRQNERRPAPGLRVVPRDFQGILAIVGDLDLARTATARRSARRHPRTRSSNSAFEAGRRNSRMVVRHGRDCPVAAQSLPRTSTRKRAENRVSSAETPPWPVLQSRESNTGSSPVGVSLRIVIASRGDFASTWA